MGDLSNKFIDESYKSLLHTTEDTGLTGTTKSVIQDGKGTDTALRLSTDKVDVNGDLQTGGVDRITSTGELTNVSGNISQFTNDEGYLSSVPPTYLQTGDNVSELTNDSGYLTSATIPSNVMREGENVSLLNNDAGYITGIPATYLQSGDNISELTNDSGYLTSIPANVMVEGENISLLNNDSGYISSIPTTYLESGDNVSELTNDSGYLTSATLPSGLLQTEDGNSLTGNRTNFTDGQGNKLGLFTWQQYGITGIDNSYNTLVSPEWTISNDNFNVNNSPLGPFGLTGLSFSDFDEYATFSIRQNRFGGVNYWNWVDGQNHIFGGQNNNSKIAMDSFNSPNNSDNWFESYNSNIINMSVTGGTELVLETRGGGTLQTTLPTGGGGAGLIDINSSNATTIGTDKFVKTTRGIDGLIYTIGTDSFNTSDTLYLTALTYKPGDIINKLAFEVKNFTSSADAFIGIYNSDAGVNEPGTLIGSTSLTITGTGYKFLENLNFALPNNNTGIYWVALYIPGGSFRHSNYSESRTINQVFNYDRLLIPPGYTGRMTYTLSGNLTSLPSDLSTATFQKDNDKEPVIIYGY